MARHQAARPAPLYPGLECDRGFEGDFVKDGSKERQRGQRMQERWLAVDSQAQQEK